MGKLQVLPSSLANMIAAGEVVQRPASVVKELVENAVDAGATQIDVEVSDSGRTLIRVVDNGCGMSAEDAVLCFERHATSKISTPEDLQSILTYGFRGEALASIAAVADVTLKTRREQDETAITVHIGATSETQKSSGPVGTGISVRNLFYNTPARRKFLKSDSVELKHIIDEFIRVALTRPENAFTLNSNGRDIYALKPAKSLKFRIMDVLGTNVSNDIVEVLAETSVVKVSGYVGRPEAARKTVPNQFFFVNGRYFRSPYFHKAVMKAYEDLMPEGLVPPYFIFLETDPEAVDVNIHPSKTEIKFEQDSMIFQVLYACVRESLGKNSFGASIDFEAAGAPEIPSIGEGFNAYKSSPAPAAPVDYSYDPFRPAAEKKQDFAALFDAEPSLVRPAARNIIVQGGRYILASAEGGTLVVNVRRARERIMYEKALKALHENVHVTQTSLFPVQVRVGAENISLFEDKADMLASLGFDISVFGSDTVVVAGVPEGYSCESGKVAGMVEDLMVILSDDGAALPEIMQSNMARKFAVLGASSCKPISGIQEASALLETLFTCAQSDFTATGKKISIVLSDEDIEKRF